jgi:hypothetical protein
MLLLSCSICGGARGGDAIPEPVRFVSSASPASQGDDAATRALESVMRRAGLRYTLNHEPTERALRSLRAGAYDADLLRYEKFDRVLPGALRVDPYILRTTVVAFSGAPLPAAGSWQAVRGLRIAYVRGIKLIEQALEGWPDVVPTTGSASCLGMAVAHRVDVCLLNVETSNAVTDLPDGARLHRTVLLNVDLHIWVAPGRQALAERLSRAVREAVASGDIVRTVGGANTP